MQHRRGLMGRQLRVDQKLGVPPPVFTQPTFTKNLPVPSTVQSDGSELTPGAFLTIGFNLT